MGYRSNVAYIIAGEKEAMMGALAEIRLAHPNIQSALDGGGEGDDAVIITETTINTNEAYRSGGDSKTMEVVTLAWKCDSVKWYDSYDFVQSHTALWNFFAERAEDMNVEGKFIRIGEEDDDNELKGFGGEQQDFQLYDVISFSRTIEVADNIAFNAKRDIRAKEAQSA
jgi:hypothetical protein